VHAKQSVAVHWGTFALADENAETPPQELQQTLDKLGKHATEFIVPVHGHTHVIKS